MGVELHWIGTGISSGSSHSRFGGILSSTPTTGGGGYPAYGTILSTSYGVDFENGYTTQSAYLGAIVYTQTCDVDTVADGYGGSFVNWTGAVNVQYKPYGTHIADGQAIGMYPVEVPTGSGVYHNSALSDDSEEIYDGTGGAIIIPIGFDHYYSNGTLIYSHSINSTTEVPSDSTHYYDNGLISNYEYQWNGSGNYNDVFINETGSLYTSGTEVDESIRYNSGYDYMIEVPSTSGSVFQSGKTYEYSYFWNGTGGYYADPTGNLFGNYNADGVFIYNDGANDWYWDGLGGYRNYP